jgi:uncharacterized protein
MTERDVNIKRTGHSVKATLATQRKVNGALPSASTGDSGDIRLNEQMKVLSGLVSRLQLANKAGLQFGGLRDMYKVFGYKRHPTTDDYLAKYMRQDIATRIIDAPPSATWSNPPTIEQDKQKDEWAELDRAVKLFPAIYRADRLARLNPFSILLYGFDDSSSMEKPVNPDKVKELLYVRAIGERLVHEVSFVSDPTNKRFGFPDIYTVKFDDPTSKSGASQTVTKQSTKDLKVHHSRVVHIVENALEDQVFGIPIMEKVYNLLDDLLKVGGGTAEMYWLAGNRGMQADIDTEMELNPEDAAALSDELDEYVHQLRRVIRTRGVELNTLESKPPNPKDVFSMIVNLISGTTGIPSRILLGSEAGQLASEQDRANWAERIEERRILYAEPNILEPTVDLFQEVGLLSEGDVTFEWPDAFIQNPLEKGQTKAQTARAIGNISRQTGNKAPMQLTSREEARELLGFEGDLDESDLIEPPEEEPSAGPFGGGAGSQSTPPGEDE